EILAWVESLRPLGRLVAGGEARELSARVIRSGPRRSRLAGPGWALGGDAAGLAPFPGGAVELRAAASGLAFGRALVAVERGGARARRSSLARSYASSLREIAEPTCARSRRRH